MRRLIPALALIAALLTGCAAASVAPPELLEPVGVRLDTAVVTRGSVYNMTIFDGAVEPYVEALYFDVDGVVGEVHARIGEAVKAGDAIITLDQTDLVETIDALDAEIAFIEQDLALTIAIGEADMRIKEHALNMLQNAPVAEADKEARRVEIELLRADMEILSAEQSHEVQRVRQLELDAKREERARLDDQLKSIAINAPYDGHIVFGRVVDRQQLKKGDPVPAYEPLAYVADDARLTIRSEYVTDSMIHAAVEIYAMIGDSTYPVELVPMDQSEYLAAVLSGQNLTSEFALDASVIRSGQVESGMYAAVCVVTNRVDDVLVVPSNAVMREGSMRYVYVIEGDARIRRDIRIGVVSDSAAEVTSGLSEGEVVYVKE